MQALSPHLGGTQRPILHFYTIELKLGSCGSFIRHFPSSSIGNCTRAGYSKLSAHQLQRFLARAEPSESIKRPEERSLFIFGFGYLALGLANLLRDQSWKIVGTSRGRQQQKALEAQGFEVYLFDTDHMTLGLGKKGITALRTASHVLVTISPSSPQELCPVTWILGREFRTVAESVKWIGYLSTTSVYGDHGGEWVTEESEARAESGNGFARRQAEIAWLRFGEATGLPVHIFRLAGIYGPGRSAIEAAQQAGGGKRTGKKFTSRCHVYDICQAVAASMERPNPGQIYNIADDDPTCREAVLEYVEQNFVDRRQRDESTLQPAEQGAEQAVAKPSRKIAEKRVSNARIKEELGVQLAFPSFREGLQAIHSGNVAPFL